jgi:hypothetical protein
MKYFDLDNDGMGKGPQRLMQNNSNTFFVLDWEFCGINFQGYFLAMQFTQTLVAFIILGRPIARPSTFIV